MSKVVAPDDLHVWFDSLSNKLWKKIVQRDKIKDYKDFSLFVNNLTPCLRN